MLLKKNIPLGYVFGKIKWEILLVALYATAIAILYNNFHITAISIPLSVPMILGTVMSLLLAFRSNQAYDRWWEARTVWGAIVNDSRTLGRQLMTYVNPDLDPDASRRIQERVLRRQIGWCFSLSHQLRGEDARSGLERFLGKRDLHHTQRFQSATVALLEQQAEDVMYAMNSGMINNYQQVEIDRTLSRLCDAMGKCERIKNTVFPVTYSLYIHLAMNFFILMLPFALIDFFDFMQVPIVVVIAGLFMLIEKMAIHLQDPFERKPTDTPMTAISTTIERDLRQMLDDGQELSNAGASSTFKGFYQM